MPEHRIARTASPATDFSVTLLLALVRCGVRHIVLSPGSRSQALALVAAELERVGAVLLHVRIDERVGGFLALGIAVESGLPAVVITTSGTATANLHPAVLEAHHSFVPMIVVTADRPRELRGIRANQTTAQPGIYGAVTRLDLDVEAPSGAPGENSAAAAIAERAWQAALGLLGPEVPAASPGPGPVQLNLAFREPLSAPVPDLTGLVRHPPVESGPTMPLTEPPLTEPTLTEPPATVDGLSTAGGQSTVQLEAGPRTIVIAGHAAGPAAEQLARTAGWPLIAEVSSRARYGPNLVVEYRELLVHEEFGGRVERVVVFGHPTLSREVPTLLQRDGVEVVVVAPFGIDYVDPGHRARRVRAVLPAPELNPSEPSAREWVGRWVFASRRIAELSSTSEVGNTAPDVAAGRSSDPADRRSFARAELAAVRAPVTRRMLVDALWRFTWPHDRLILGASRLIREADRSVPGKNIPVHSNRGLAGIDGTIATGIGVALASPDTGVTRVLLGDLALLHDVGSLLFGDREQRPRIQVVVGNDGGGTIFDALEVAWTAPREAMERVLLTPQCMDVAALAAAYGWSYSRATTRGELDQALSAAIVGPSILEVPLPR